MHSGGGLVAVAVGAGDLLVLCFVKFSNIYNCYRFGVRVFHNFYFEEEDLINSVMPTLLVR